MPAFSRMISPRLWPGLGRNCILAILSALILAGAARAQEDGAPEAARMSVAQYYHAFSPRDESLIALAVDEKLGFAQRHGRDAAGLTARLTERRRQDLAERGVAEADLPARLLRCLGSIDFEGVSARRLRDPLETDAAPALWRARTILRAADELALSVAHRDPDRRLRDVVLDVIVAYCVIDAQ